MYSKGALRGSQQITPGPGEPPHPTPTSPGTSESRVPWDALGSFLPLEVLRRTTVLHNCFRGCGGRAPVCHCGRVLGGRAARGRPYPEGGSAAAEASGNRRLGGGGAQAAGVGGGPGVFDPRGARRVEGGKSSKKHHRNYPFYYNCQYFSHVFKSCLFMNF